MKLGKKVIFIGLFCVLLLGLMGCSDDENTTESYKLSVSAETKGTGTVTVNPKQDNYEKNEQVTLTASGEGEYSFDHWEGSGYKNNTDNPLTVTMTGDITLVAVFKDKAAPAWLLEPEVTSPTDTDSVGISLKIDEAGILYYKIMSDGVTKPTVSEIKKAANSISISASTKKEITVKGLNSGEDYDIFFVAEDNNHNLQDKAVIKKVGVSTIAASEMIQVSSGTTAANNGELSLDYNLEIGKYEVTHKEYIEFLNDIEITAEGYYEEKQLIDTDSNSCAISYDGNNFYFKGNDVVDSRQSSVIEVTWYGALAYCNWLSKQEGLNSAYDLNSWGLKDTPDKVEGYRLPTDTEWEYIARGGTNGQATVYAGSDNLDEVAWHYANSYDLGVSHEDYGIHPGGEKMANELNIYDMSGNVWEWTTTTDQINRIARGGCWNGASADNCELTTINYVTPSGAANNLGFRLTRTKQ